MRILSAAFALASCYRPSVAPCQYHCAADNACPDGLMCNLQLGGMCVTAADPMCLLGLDGGGMDGGRTSDTPVTTDVMPSSCQLFGAATAMTAPNGATPHSIATGDLNHDGRVDAVVASETPEIGVDFGEPELFGYQPVTIGSNNIAYQAVPFSLGSGSNSNGIAYSFTTNGFSYVSEKFFAGQSPDLPLAAAIGAGDGTTPIALAVADYDVGTPSITAVVASSAASTVYTYGNSTADPSSDQLTSQYVSLALPPAITAAMGKIDSDAQTDVVLVYGSAAQVLYDPYRSGGDATGSDSTSLLMPFAGTPAAAALVTLGTASSTGPSLDLVIATGDGLLVGYSQNSRVYPFGSGFALVPYAMNPEGIATGDFDRDGYQDVIVADGGSNLVVFESIADGSFKEPLTISVGSAGIALAGALAAGDLTNDGVPDLLVAGNVELVMMLPDTCGSGS